MSRIDASSIEIAGRAIGADCPVYVIAELSCNHNGSLERGFEIIDAAAAAGASAVKLQTYRPERLTLDSREPPFLLRPDDPNGPSLYDLYQDAQTPLEWHGPLFERARSHGMHAFSSPFDVEAVDDLERLDVPAYKIASFELVDTGLIEAVARTGKPIIASTGMADFEEIGLAVEVARSAGCEQLVLLHCVSGYPTPVEEANLATIPVMREAFGVPVGWSDHTDGIAAALSAVSLGACAVEKHLTLSRADGGHDAAFSLEPEELARFAREAEICRVAIGRPSFGAQPSERMRRGRRRSLYVVVAKRAGETLVAGDVRSLRPALGLAPRELPSLLGRTLRVDVAAGTPLTQSLLEPA